MQLNLTNYVTNFTAVDTASVINFSWTDASPGSQIPSEYLLIIYNRDTYFIPIDGETYVNDTTFTDGKAVINITYTSPNTYQLTGVAPNTNYFALCFHIMGQVL